MNHFAAVPVETFGAIVARHARDRPDAIAVRFGDRAWSYAAYDAQANRIAHALLRDGFQPGDRIAHLGKNSDVVPLLALAAARAGLIFVPVNWRLAEPEIAHILADSGARVLVIGEGGGIGTGLPTLPEAALIEDSWPAADAHEPKVSGDDDATVMLTYTSGTTGLPKGVMLSHRSLFGTSTLRAAAQVAWDDWSAADVTLVALPLAHIGGFAFMARTLFFGGEAVIQPGFDPGQVLDAIERQRISKLGLVPTAIKMVIDHSRSRSVDYRRIRTMAYGAAPITVDLLREAIAVFGCEFAQSYGMSETAATCVALPPEDHDVDGTPRMRSAGCALPGTELRIVGPDGAVLGEGETGEIAIRSIAMMNGYWRQPEATAAVLSGDGWYRTGDAGYLDADGYLFIKDRVKDMIVSGAENVYPAEVENVLAAHPAVSDVAVIGVPDPLWGEAVKAVVVPRPGATFDEAATIAWIKERLAHYKTPKSIDVVDALPLNSAGKIQKSELRRRYWQHAERQVN